MTQIGEGVFVNTASPELEQDDEQKKTPKKIRISLFFDGTLNNRTNIEAREADSPEYQRYSKPGNSFENGRTNIAIMQHHLKEKGVEGYDFYAKAYIEGQGTFNLKKDSFPGYAVAIGESGVPGRAKKGVQIAINRISRYKKFNKDDNYIKKLTIDVFGFSRGAATARYAIYLLLKDNRWAIYQRLQNMGYTIDESAVEISFAGLYDTVLSYMGSQRVKWSNNTLKQTAVSLAKKCLHLASAEEHRKDFPLHNIRSAGSSGEEYYLPGVHSDVGGSYNKANEKLIEQAQPGDKVEYMTTNNESMIINEGSQKVMLADRQQLIDQGWYKPAQIKVIGATKRGLTIRYLLVVERENIRSAYSNIPLKIMADMCRSAEVKLKIDDKLEDRANIILNAEPDLLQLEQEIRAYIAKKPQSKPQDWFDNPRLCEIRNRHLNFSAKMQTGYKPNIVDKQGVPCRQRYIYDA